MLLIASNFDLIKKHPEPPDEIDASTQLKTRPQNSPRAKQPGRPEWPPNRSLSEKSRGRHGDGDGGSDFS